MKLRKALGAWQRGARSRRVTNVYIDGLNLYNGLKREYGGRGKWLDLKAFAEVLTGAGRKVGDVRYFTSQIAVIEPKDEAALQRQQIYLRAAGSLERVSLHEGYMKVSRKMRLLATPRDDWPKRVRVVLPQEKGSDVSLGAHLVLDAALGRFGEAIVVSNDSTSLSRSGL